MTTRILLVGDSISHGREGDWTWRYRLWQWTRLHRVPATFVGPYTGTVPPDDPAPPRPPPLPTDPDPPAGGGWPRTDGGYAHGVDADFLSSGSRHFAVGGRQAKQAKHLIAEQIALHRPSLVLVQLGFNDLAWRVSGPHETLASVRELVERARAVYPFLGFAIANVPHRTPFLGGEYLPAITNEYNALLAAAIPEWSTPNSPVVHVPFCEHYTAASAAYDGLHPNSLGEYQLCHAFTLALSTSFIPGLPPLPIPASPPTRPIPTPTPPTPLSTPSGARFTWPQVYGALGYLIRYRPTTTQQWTTCRLPPLLHPQFSPPLDQLPPTGPNEPVVEVEFQVATTPGSLPTDRSPWSNPVIAVHAPLTSPPPGDITIHGTADGFRVSWTERPESEHVDRYGVVVWDIGTSLVDDDGAFPCMSVGVRGKGVEVAVQRGRRYRVHVMEMVLLLRDLSTEYQT